MPSSKWGMDTNKGECPKCNGTGHFSKSSCPTCDGKGYIIIPNFSLQMLDKDEIEMLQREEEKNRDGYSLYNERYKLFEFGYLTSYKLDKANIQKYEFTEPFEILDTAYKDKKYTFLEKLADKPKKDIEEWKKDENEKHNKKCTTANHLLRQSEYIVREISNRKIKATDYLNIAEKEFSRNTFSLFWQAIENATLILDPVAFLVWGVSVKINIDYRVITCKFRKFPPFFFLEAIPDFTDLINKYDKMVYQGLSNYEFASILEAYKTRKTIIEGFNSLESAVQGVKDTLHDGFVNLNKQLAFNAQNQILATNIQTLIFHYGLKEKTVV